MPESEKNRKGNFEHSTKWLRKNKNYLKRNKNDLEERSWVSAMSFFDPPFQIVHFESWVKGKRWKMFQLLKSIVTFYFFFFFFSFLSFIRGYINQIFNSLFLTHFSRPFSYCHFISLLFTRSHFFISRRWWCQ